MSDQCQRHDELRRLDDDRWITAFREIAALRNTTDTLSSEVKLLRETTGAINVHLAESKVALKAIPELLRAHEKMALEMQAVKASAESSAADIASAKRHGLAVIGSLLVGGLIALGFAAKLVWNHVINGGDKPVIP